MLDPRPSSATMKLLSIIGARPQFIKIAPVCRAVEVHNRQPGTPWIEHVLVHTGQHYDHEMAELFFDELAIPEPKYNLAVGSAPQYQQISAMIERLQPVLSQESPDWVVVYGDTNSTLAGALVAARLGIPLAHVEAGCRSYNMQMPEEQNRIVADHLAQLLLTVTASTADNLYREGIGAESDPRKRSVIRVGDLMYDALLAHLPVAESRVACLLERLDLLAGQYYLLTLHRAENTQNRQAILRILQVLDGQGLPVLFPVHPRTRHFLLATGGMPQLQHLVFTAPLSYLEMLAAEKHARAVLTDSGGVQKECFYLRVPCLTLRSETEWPETVRLGANTLVGTDAQAIAAALRRPPVGTSSEQPFGSGDTARQILQSLTGLRELSSVED